MKLTDFGFRWGPLDVTRIAHAKRGSREVYVLGVKTDYRDVQISVSRTGRSVRVWIDGQELAPVVLATEKSQRLSQEAQEAPSEN